MESAINNLKTVMGADTIIGDAINTESGTVIIPVSKLSVGFVSGGLDYAGKVPEKQSNNFGGGGGTGLTMTPVCFLVIDKNGKVEVLGVNSPARNHPDPVSDIIGFIEKSPELISKFKEAFGKKKDEETEDTTAE